MIDLSPYLGTLAAVAGTVTLITGWINSHILKFTGVKSQILSWVVSILIAFFAKWQGLGIFADTNTLWTILNSVAIGLVSNGLYSVEGVQKILELIKAKPIKN